MKRGTKGSDILLPRFRVIHNGETALGPGKVDLLKVIDETGSLLSAAKSMNMSYMRAWKLVQTMNKCFREPLAVSERGGKSGGGMKLTETGREVLRLYQRIEASALKSSTVPWGELQKLLRN